MNMIAIIPNSEPRTAEEVIARARIVAAKRKASVTPVKAVTPVVPIQKPLTVIMAPCREVGINDWMKEPEGQDFPMRITMPDIIKAVVIVTGVKKNELISSRRTVEYSKARQCAMYIASKETTLSFPQIGNLLGNRDHTTIMHGVRVTQERIDAGDMDVIAMVNATCARLGIEALA